MYTKLGFAQVQPWETHISFVDSGEFNSKELVVGWLGLLLICLWSLKKPKTHFFSRIKQWVFSKITGMKLVAVVFPDLNSHPTTNQGEPPGFQGISVNKHRKTLGFHGISWATSLKHFAAWVWFLGRSGTSTRCWKRWSSSPFTGGSGWISLGKDGVVNGDFLIGPEKHGRKSMG